jgi:hypothetical protein
MLPFLGIPFKVASSSGSRLSRGEGIVGLGSRVSCRPPLSGGGVNGAGIDELSDELRLVSCDACDEPPSVVGETRVGSRGWISAGEVLGRRAMTMGRGSTRGSMSRMASWISSISGRAAGSTSQQDCMSSHIFELRPTAAVPGCSGGMPWLNRTGT